MKAVSRVRNAPVVTAIKSIPSSEPPQQKTLFLPLNLRLDSSLIKSAHHFGGTGMGSCPCNVVSFPP